MSGFQDSSVCIDAMMFGGRSVMPASGSEPLGRAVARLLSGSSCGLLMGSAMLPHDPTSRGFLSGQGDCPQRAQIPSVQSENCFTPGWSGAGSVSIQDAQTCVLACMPQQSSRLSSEQSEFSSLAIRDPGSQVHVDGLGGICYRGLRKPETSFSWLSVCCPMPLQNLRLLAACTSIATAAASGDS